MAPNPRSTRRRTEKVSQSVAREILHDISRRGVSDGEMLPPESQMLETYQVGRASLREALRLLEIQGLITLKPGPGGGPVVNGAHSDDLGRTATMYFHMAGARFRELLEARLVVEPVMVRVAAQRQDPDYLAELQRVVERQTRNPMSEVEAYTQSSFDFHSLIAGMSGNRILDLIGRALKDIYSDRIREMIFREDERDKIIEAHGHIAKAILDGNADKAQRLMHEHMVDFAQTVEERFPGVMYEIIDWR